MVNKILVILAVACISPEFVSTATDKVVCYHGTWARYRTGNGQFTVANIDTSLCTHIIYSFVGINTNGTINLLDEYLDITLGNFASFNALKTQNANLKTLVAVGGWNEGSTKYSTVAADATLRATFIQSALSLVQTYNFDGFDLDWEYPGQRGGVTADIANFATLIKEFREVFDNYGLLLTAAVAAASSSVDLSYDVPSLSQYLDFINVMTYDLHGSWDAVTGQNSPLYASSIDTTAASQLLNVDSAIKGWISRGADPQKLVLGMGTYGRTFTLSNTSNTALGAPASGAGTSGPYTQEAGYLGYNEICEKQLAGGWTTIFDEEQKVPYTYNGDQWVGYDNAKSITLKVEYAKSLNLSGVMIWALETEDFNGICGTKYPLLNAINTCLGITSSNSTATTTTTTAGATTTTTASTTTATTAATTTTTTAAADTTSTNTTAICSAVGYVRDTSNCNVYYYCMLVGSSYVAITQQCSAGLYYDLTTLTCNWPAAVTGC